MKHDLRAQLDTQDKKKFICSLRVLNHVRADRRLIATNTELRQFKLHFVVLFSPLY